MVRIKHIFSILISYLFLAIIWDMIAEFKPPPWASEDVDDAI